MSPLVTEQNVFKGHNGTMFSYPPKRPWWGKKQGSNTIVWLR